MRLRIAHSGSSRLIFAAVAAAFAAGICALAAPPKEDLVLVRVKFTVDPASSRNQNDWNAKAFAKVLFNIGEALRRATGVNVAKDPKVLTLDDPELPSYPLLLMMGHYGPTLNAQEVAALREHLTKGGFLLATSCCGNDSFTKNFEREMKKVFPGKELKPLPETHDVYKVFHEIKGVARYAGSKNTEANKRIERTPLKGIEIDDRAVVMFSPNALTCGWARLQSCGSNCKRIDPDNAYSLTINTILYALTH